MSHSHDTDPVDAGARRFLAEPAKRMLIDGEWVADADGATLPVHDPATEQRIATVPDAGQGAVDAAVQAASRAFQSRAWSGLAPAERERRLLRLADLIDTHTVELTHLLVLENGKLLSAARREVGGSVRFTRYAAGWATKISGDTLDVSMTAADTDFFAYTRREPVGVVAAVIPWNMPLSMAVWKVVPALACGCTVVLKPSEETPLTALRLGELAIDAGIPSGVLNIVTGTGETTGAALVAHPGVRKITFTGSTAVGMAIGQTAMRRLARVSLELGGKSPVIVMEDADLTRVPEQVAQGIFYNQGQICAAGSRLYVHRSRFDEVVERVVAIAGDLSIGSGFEAGAELGPLVSAAQRQKVLALVEAGVTEGAEILVGGRAPDRTGYFVEPTIVTRTAPTMRIVREEVFGPVLAVAPFDDLDQLVELANGSTYGLAASIYSRDLATVHRLIPRLSAGTIFVNTPVRTDPNLPFGGFKQSGIGREHGHSMIDLYTELKSVVIAH